MAKLSLKDVIRYMETIDKSELVDNPDMQDYVEEMQIVGTDVLKNLSAREISAVVSFMESIFCIQMMMNNPTIGIVLISQMDELALAMGQALKVAIGITLSEEWR